MTQLSGERARRSSPDRGHPLVALPTTNTYQVRAAFDRADWLLEQGRDRRAESAEEAAIKLTLAAPTGRVARVFTDRDGESIYDLPEVSLLGLAHWLDRRVPPVPLPQLNIDMAAASRLALAINTAAASILGGCDNANSALAAALRDGLDQRQGLHLTDSEQAVYVTLRHLTSDDDAPAAHVCDVCMLVFAAARARECPRCRRAPERYSPRPWHRHISWRDRRPPRSDHRQDGNVVTSSGTVRRPGRSRTSYETVCADCSGTFIAEDARARFCPPCDTRTARRRRSRA